jgi:C4-dicarboxylate transporter DctM subunit
VTELALIALLIGLLLSGLPVAFALALTGIIAGYLFQGLAALIMVPQVMYAGTNSFLLIAVPLFVLMSEIISRTGVGEILFETADRWVRHLPGGLAIATVATEAILSGVTGSSIADTATIGIIAVPAMLNRGYERKFVYGLVCASGTLGILIPPSIPMILYGAITGESVGKLFIAGVVPGLLLAAILIGYVLIVCSRGRGFQRLPPASWPDRWSQTRKALWGLLLPPLVIGGMYSGIFTPTEAAGVGVVYTLLVSHFAYRSLKPGDVRPILMETLTTTSMIIFITAGALVLGNVITIMQVPQQLVKLVNDWQLPAWGFLIFINLLLLILGCLLDVVSILFITIPIIFPILLQLGIDPIWFAIIFTVNMQIAQVTPPVGMVLYVMVGISGRPMAEIIRGVTPFIFLLVGYLVIVMRFPQLSLWLTQYVK